MAATSWLGALVEGGVDLVGPVGAGVGDEQVAGDGEDRQRVRRRVEVEDHHHVAVDTVDPLRAQAVGGVLHGQGAAVGGADQQDVLRARVGAAGRDLGQAVHVDPVDLVVQVPGVPGRGPDDEGHHQPDRAQHVGHGPASRSARAGSACAPGSGSAPGSGPGSGLGRPAPSARPRRSGGPARAVPVRPGCPRGQAAAHPGPPAGPVRGGPCGRGRFRQSGELMVSVVRNQRSGLTAGPRAGHVTGVATGLAAGASY